MAEQTPIPLREENIPALIEKHSAKIDSAVGKDSDTQQARLRLFDHDPQAMAAHYPELQKKSQELKERNDALQKSAATAGWTAAIATAAITGFAAMKKKISPSNLIQGIVVVLTSITAGFAANFATDRLLGKRIREESSDVAEAARKAYERELGVYMEDTATRLAALPDSEKKAAEVLHASISKIAEDKKAIPELAKTESHAAAVEKSRAEAPQAYRA